MRRAIDDYMSPSEAAYRWSIPLETLKNKLKPSVNKNLEEAIKSGIVKSFKHPEGKRNEWIISVSAMEMWYGKEPE